MSAATTELSPVAETPSGPAELHPDDALELKRLLVPGARVAIIGAGYIGLEVAAGAAAKGCDVTVLEFQDRVMSRVTSEPVSRFFEQLHEQNGVRFVFGAAVTAVEGTDRAERIVTADGAVYPADVVLAGIGVVPNQELAETAGLECQDGILVDGDGKTSDPHIYAAGDATRFTSNIDGASQRLECIQNAMAQAGRVAADKFSVVYVRDGRLAAVDTVAGLTDFRPAKKLIAQRARIDPFLAADSGTPLTDAVFAAS